MAESLPPVMARITGQKMMMPRYHSRRWRVDRQRRADELDIFESISQYESPRTHRAPARRLGTAAAHHALAARRRLILRLARVSRR